MLYKNYIDALNYVYDEKEFDKIIQNIHNLNTGKYNCNNIYFSILREALSSREFTDFPYGFSKEHLNFFFFKVFNLIDFTLIDKETEHERSWLLSSLIDIDIENPSLLDKENKKLIEKHIFNNPAYFKDDDVFLLGHNNYYNKLTISYVMNSRCDLLIKHFMPFFFNSYENFSNFFYHMPIELFKQVVPKIYNDSLYNNEEGIKKSNYLENLKVINIGMPRIDNAFNDQEAGKIFWTLLFYIPEFFFELLEQYSSKEDEKLLEKIIFLSDNEFINLSDIITNWKKQASSISLSSNISQSIDKYRSHCFLKLVKKGFHKTALYFLKNGYSLSEEENSYLVNISKKTAQTYSDYTFDIKDSFFNDFKFNIDRMDTNKTSYKKIEDLFKDENDKSSIFNRLIEEDNKSFKKLLPELINISKSDINKYDFLSTVDILIVNMNTTAIETLFEYKYPFNLKQMLLFCRFTRKHYDKYKRVISYLSDLLVEKSDHYNYFLSHNLNIAKEDGIQINEKYVRQLTGNYGIPLNKGMGLSAINKLSEHLRYKNGRLEYYRDSLNLNMYSYFLEQDYNQIQAYYDIASISYIVLLKADEGFDVSSLMNALTIHNALEEIDDIINLINQVKKEHLSAPLKHFLMLNDKRKLNEIVEGNQQGKTRKRI